MAITVRKKTLKLKRPGEEHNTASEAAEDRDETDATTEADAPVLAMVQKQQAGRPASYMFAAICGIIATLLLAALVAVQFMENSYYRSAIPLFRP